MKNKLYPTLTSLLAFCATYGVQVYEGFDYTIPGDLVGSGGIGWSSAWGTFPIGGGAINGGIGGQGSVTAVDVQAESIAAPAGYTATRSGGETIGVDGYPTAWRELAAANRISTTADGTVYFSFLFKMDAVGVGLGGSYLLLDFIAADRTDLFRVGVGTGLGTAAIQYSTSNTLLATGDTITAGTSYLLIGKLETAVGADTLSVNVYASSETIGAEPLVWEMTASQDLDVYAEIDRIGLLFGGLDGDPAVDHTGYIDELRFGDTFASVISDPVLPVADGVKYTFETVIINSPADDETPNDLLPDPDTYDLALPAVQGGATNAMAIGAGRDGGNAFNPDGSGYAVLPASAVDTQFDGATALTIMGWYKSSDLTQTGRIVDTTITGNANGFFLRVDDTTALDARLRIGDGIDGINIDSDPGFFVDNGTWQFFAVTWDGTASGEVKFYSGTEVEQATQFGAAQANGQTALGNFGAATNFPQLTLGVQATSPSIARFTGLLDDIEIYGQALTLEEIQAAQGVDNSEVAAYSFETISIQSPADDATPNDFLPDPDAYDLAIPAFRGGAAAAIAYGTGRNGGNAYDAGNPGQGYVVLPGSANDTALDGADALTIIGWYKSSSLAPGGRIADTMISGNANGFFLRVNDVLGNDARLRLGDGTVGVNVDSAANYFINDGTWQFFAVTWDANDSGNVSFYRGDESIPASLFEAKAGPVNPLGNFGAAVTFPQLTLGAQATSSSSARFTGLLDDIKIYKQALTLAEIEAIRQSVPLLQPVGLYVFDTGTNVEVSFETVAGLNYQLQVSTDLSGWSNVAGQSVAGDGAVKTLVDPSPASGEKAFYRVRVE